jgi:hypothetical protein
MGLVEWSDFKLDILTGKICFLGVPYSQETEAILRPLAVPII